MITACSRSSFSHSCDQFSGRMYIATSADVAKYPPVTPDDFRQLIERPRPCLPARHLQACDIPQIREAGIAICKRNLHSLDEQLTHARGNSFFIVSFNHLDPSGRFGRQQPDE